MISALAARAGLVGGVSVTPGSVPQGHVYPALLCLSLSSLAPAFVFSWPCLAIFLPTLRPLQGQGLLSQDTQPVPLKDTTPGPQALRGSQGCLLGVLNSSGGLRGNDILGIVLV